MALKHEKPNEVLMAELIEVRDAARDMETALGTAIALPNDFPRNPMEDMLHSLQGLPDGTAVEAHPILHAADKRLVRIRHAYFRHKPGDETERNPEFIPPTERQQNLDMHQSRLRNAIGSALEECRIQEIGDNPDPDFDPWGYDELDTEAETESLHPEHRLELGAQSAELETAIGEANSVASKLLNRDSTSSDNFLRGLKDTDNLNKMNRAELLFSKGRASIRKMLADAIASKPVILRSLAKNIRAGVDFARPLNAEWKAFKKDKFSYVLDKVNIFAGQIEEWADESDAEAKFSMPPPVDPETQQAAEAEAKRLLRQNKPVPDEVAKNVRSLDLDNSDFALSILLNNFLWLRSLNLYRTQVSDLSPIRSLANLQLLSLTGTQVSDLSPIGGLANLQGLYLNDTQVSDLSPIGGLANLQELYLDATQVSDLSPIGGLANLQRLYLNRTPISDLVSISGLVNLQRLSLKATKISDLVPLRNLVNLKWLDVSNTLVTDLAPLSDLPNLEWIMLFGTKVKDLSPVVHLKHVFGRPEG